MDYKDSRVCAFHCQARVQFAARRIEISRGFTRYLGVPSPCATKEV